MATELTELKCRNCEHGTNLLFHTYCPFFDFLLRKNANGCMAWMRKLKPRERRESLTK